MVAINRRFKERSEADRQAHSGSIIFRWVVVLRAVFRIETRNGTVSFQVLLYRSARIILSQANPILIPAVVC